MNPGATMQNHEMYRDGGELFVALKGRIVLEDLSGLKQSVLPNITPNTTHVYVDLVNVDYVDSAGLGLLIGFKMTSKSQGAGISLMDPNKNVQDVLAISRIDGIFDFLRGPDAGDVRARLAQPPFSVPVNAGGGGNVTTGSFESGGTPLPQVTSEGMLEDASEEMLQKKEAVEDQCRLAVEAMRQGDYEKSIDCYKKALEIDPEYLPALNNLAIVYEKQPIWHPLAIETWNKVLDLSRANSDSKHADRAQRHLTDLGV